MQTTLAQLRAMAPGPYVGSTLPAAAGVGGAAGTSGAPAAAAAAAAAPVAMATTATDGAAPVGANGAAAVVPAAAASAGIEAPPLPATATKAPAEVPSGRTLDLAPSPPGLGGKVGSLTVRQVQVRAGATPGQVLAGEMVGGWVAGRRWPLGPALLMGLEEGPAVCSILCAGWAA